MMPKANALVALLCVVVGGTTTSLPPPTGEFGVGVSRHVIPFRNHDDPVWPGNVSTEYLATAYYPTEEPGQTTRYMEPELAEIYEKGWNITAGSLANLTAMLAPGAPYLPLSLSQGPTIVFNPGGMGPPSSVYTAIITDLVSRGYVVFALDHVYEQPFVRYPNGTGVRGLPLDFQYDLDFVERLHEARRRATLHFIHYLPQLVEGLGARFATTGLGVFGGSLGGSLAFAAALGSNEVDAAVNLDGTLWGDLVANDSSVDTGKPVLFLATAGHSGDGDPSWATFPAWQTGWWRLLSVAGTLHSDWSDVTFWKQFGMNKATGDIDGRRMIDLSREYIGAFFGRHLRGEDAPILDAPAEEWPEVEVTDGRNGTRALD